MGTFESSAMLDAERSPYERQIGGKLFLKNLGNQYDENVSHFGVGP
jgi:hypothetical protein